MSTPWTCMEDTEKQEPQAEAVRRSLSRGLQIWTSDGRSHSGSSDKLRSKRSTHHTNTTHRGSGRSLLDEQTTQLYIRVLEDVFGLSKQYAEEWPGTYTYFSVLERALRPLLDHDPSLFDQLVQPPEVGSWLRSVVAAFESIKNENTSIDNAHRQMLLNTGLQPGTFKAAQKSFLLFATFVSICWMTLILAPATDDARLADIRQDQQSMFEVPGHKGPTVHTAPEAARRPLGKMLKSVRHTNWLVPASDLSASDEIYASSIAYYSLSAIGRVRIRWIEDVSRHLHFDRQSRSLYIFRLPSFCVLTIRRKRSVKALDDALCEFFLLPDANCSACDQDLAREILLSYRVIFAQQKQSRALIKEELSMERKSDHETDPFLVQICGRRSDRSFKAAYKNMWPPSCQDFDEGLQEHDLYSAKEDFPYLGSRLLRLQQYNLRQEPRRIRDLWRDRRNTLQWYTFWAVIWVGGASILLSFLQLMASIAQLYYTLPGR